MKPEDGNISFCTFYFSLMCVLVSEDLQWAVTPLFFVFSLLIFFFIHNADCLLFSCVLMCWQLMHWLNSLACHSWSYTFLLAIKLCVCCLLVCCLVSQFLLESCILSIVLHCITVWYWVLCCAALQCGVSCKITAASYNEETSCCSLGLTWERAKRKLTLCCNNRTQLQCHSDTSTGDATRKELNRPLAS